MKKITTNRRLARRRQRGISLFVVLVMVLLTALMTLWAARTALFNELVTSNDSDYQRALEAAHAMVRDAELDIMGIRPDTQPCATTPGFVNCRPALVAANLNLGTGQVFFPPSRDPGYNDNDSVMLLLSNAMAATPAGTPSCVAGICMALPVVAPVPPAPPAPARLLPEFWNSADAVAGLGAMTLVGARYGEFTGADPAALGNPLLVPARASAFYWIEPIFYQANGSAAARDYAPFGGPASATTGGVVYRITALAQGLKPGTQAVLQTVFVRKEASGG